MKNNSKYNLIFFDFGGTLDTNGIHWSEMFWVYYKLYKLFNDKAIYEDAYRESQKILDNSDILKDKDFKWTITKQLSLQNEYLASNVDNFHFDEKTINSISEDIYKNVKITINNNIKIINKIKNNYKLGIVSNFNGNLDIVCKEFELDKLFKYLIDSEVIKIWKPDPAIFDYAIKLADSNSNNTIVIGDSYSRDIEPAKSIGCTTIWLNKQSWEKPQDITKADYVIKSLFELPILFNNNL